MSLEDADPNDGREDGQEPARKSFTLRGGGWNYRSFYLRASLRIIGTPDYHDLNVGLRLARHPPRVRA